jgi:hypothetical protein
MIFGKRMQVILECWSTGLRVHVPGFSSQDATCLAGAKFKAQCAEASRGADMPKAFVNQVAGLAGYWAKKAHDEIIAMKDAGDIDPATLDRNTSVTYALWDLAQEIELRKDIELMKGEIS